MTPDTLVEASINNLAMGLLKCLNEHKLSLGNQSPKISSHSTNGASQDQSLNHWLDHPFKLQILQKLPFYVAISLKELNTEFISPSDWRAYFFNSAQHQHFPAWIFPVGYCWRDIPSTRFKGFTLPNFKEFSKELGYHYTSQKAENFHDACFIRANDMHEFLENDKILIRYSISGTLGTDCVLWKSFDGIVDKFEMISIYDMENWNEFSEWQLVSRTQRIELDLEFVLEKSREEIGALFTLLSKNENLTQIFIKRFPWKSAQVIGQLKLLLQMNIQRFQVDFASYAQAPLYGKFVLCTILKYETPLRHLIITQSKLNKDFLFKQEGECSELTTINFVDFLHLSLVKIDIVDLSRNNFTSMDIHKLLERIICTRLKVKRLLLNGILSERDFLNFAHKIKLNKPLSDHCEIDVDARKIWLKLEDGVMEIDLWGEPSKFVAEGFDEG